jgi:hypothetical protein
VLQDGLDDGLLTLQPMPSVDVTELRHLSILSAKGLWPSFLCTPNLRYLDLSISSLPDLPSGILRHLKYLRLGDKQVCAPLESLVALVKNGAAMFHELSISNLAFLLLIAEPAVDDVGHAVSALRGSACGFLHCCCERIWQPRTAVLCTGVMLSVKGTVEARSSSVGGN